MGKEIDTSIREFNTKNIIDQFQRQLALVFSPLEGYVFGSANFATWFEKKFDGVKLATMDRQVRSTNIPNIHTQPTFLHHPGWKPSWNLPEERDGALRNV